MKPLSGRINAVPPQRFLGTIRYARLSQSPPSSFSLALQSIIVVCKALSRFFLLFCLPTTLSLFAHRSSLTNFHINGNFSLIHLKAAIRSRFATFLKHRWLFLTDVLPLRDTGFGLASLLEYGTGILRATSGSAPIVGPSICTYGFPITCSPEAGIRIWDCR